MLCNEYAKFLNVSDHSFTASDGRNVNFKRIYLIPSSDNIPLELNISPDAAASCGTLQAYDDIQVAVEVSQNRGYVKARVTSVLPVA